MKKVILRPPEATGWRFSVWTECVLEGQPGHKDCLVFEGHAMGWIEAQQLVRSIYKAALEHYVGLEPF